jgi:small GTP-binding protein
LTVIKISLLGDGAVGKTALLKWYVTKKFQSSYLKTIGTDFLTHNTEIDGKTIKFQCWDIAGQPLYKTVRPIFYRGTMGALLVYDITRIETYLNMLKWLEELFKYSGRGPVPIVLLANKEDLRYKVHNPIPRKYGLDLSREIDEITANRGFNCSFFETSAKIGLKVNTAFMELGKKILTYIDARMSTGLQQTSTRILKS